MSRFFEQRQQPRLPVQQERRWSRLKLDQYETELDEILDKLPPDSWTQRSFDVVKFLAITIGFTPLFPLLDTAIREVYQNPDSITLESARQFSLYSMATGVPASMVFALAAVMTSARARWVQRAMDTRKRNRQGGYKKDANGHVIHFIENDELEVVPAFDPGDTASFFVPLKKAVHFMKAHSHTLSHLAMIYMPKFLLGGIGGGFVVRQFWPRDAMTNMPELPVLYATAMVGAIGYCGHIVGKSFLNFEGAEADKFDGFLDAIKTVFSRDAMFKQKVFDRQTGLVNRVDKSRALRVLCVALVVGVMLHSASEVFEVGLETVAQFCKDIASFSGNDDALDYIAELIPVQVTALIGGPLLIFADAIIESALVTGALPLLKQMSILSLLLTVYTACRVSGASLLGGHEISELMMNGFGHAHEHHADPTDMTSAVSLMNVTQVLMNATLPAMSGTAMPSANVDPAATAAALALETTVSTILFFAASVVAYTLLLGRSMIEAEKHIFSRVTENTWVVGNQASKYARQFVWGKNAPAPAGAARAANVDERRGLLSDMEAGRVYDNPLYGSGGPARNGPR